MLTLAVVFGPREPFSAKIPAAESRRSGFGKNNCVYTSIKTFMRPAQPAGKGLIAWSAFLSVDCACSNRCLIMEQECGGNGGGDKPEPL